MRYIFHLLVIALLTLVTQVGGLLYIIGVIAYKLVKIQKLHFKLLLISFIYLIGIFAVVPPIAKINNRVSLPVFQKGKTHVVPHNLFTVLACRNYVRPDLKVALLEVSETLDKSYPGIKIRYLDANFPLLKKFRMYPHLRHDNGKKLDIAFIQKKEKSGKYTGNYFSLFGYGFSEKPMSGETNFPLECKNQGKWQYNIIEQVVPDQKWRNLKFPVAENKALVEGFANHKNVRKVFIEPHLKERLDLNSNENVRFHGCWAVRHDDHMHIEMR